MYDYVVNELPKLLSDNFQQLDTSRASIFGHSMGGHGALTIYLKNPSSYKVCFLMFHFLDCTRLVDAHFDDNQLHHDSTPTVGFSICTNF